MSKIRSVTSFSLDSDPDSGTFPTTYQLELVNTENGSVVKDKTLWVVSLNTTDGHIPAFAYLENNGIYLLTSVLSQDSDVQSIKFHGFKTNDENLKQINKVNVKPDFNLVDFYPSLNPSVRAETAADESRIQENASLINKMFIDYEILNSENQKGGKRRARKTKRKSRRN